MNFTSKMKKKLNSCNIKDTPCTNSSITLTLEYGGLLMYKDDWYLY